MVLLIKVIDGDSRGDPLPQCGDHVAIFPLFSHDQLRRRTAAIIRPRGQESVLILYTKLYVKLTSRDDLVPTILTTRNVGQDGSAASLTGRGGESAINGSLMGDCFTP